MAAGAKKKLVEVSELPPRVRGGEYVDLVGEFVNGKMKYAKVEGAKPAASVSLKKAVAAAGASNKVEVAIRNGEVYLAKK